jgi:hypothetical protein
MIAVLGSRTGAKQRLLQGLALAGASEIEPFNTIEAFTAANKPASLVVVDCAAAVQESNGIPALAEWRRVHPGSLIVSYFTGEGGSGELRVLKDSIQVLDAELLDVTEALHTPTWTELLERARQGTDKLCGDIRERFLKAVERTGRQLQSERTVLLILDHAPDNPSVTQMATELHDSTVCAGRARLARVLRNDKTLLPSDIIVLMKVLWYVHLRDCGWEPAAIAEFLHTTPRNWRKHTHDRYGLTATLMAGLPSDLVFEWVAGLCVEPYPEPPSPRGIVERLMALAPNVVIQRVRNTSRNRV